ncbi:M48 family metallopeptidase [Pseudomonas sessilinigenes]|uniref:M48 family metallopeptidase n=1 Tax=Pseudomonas sessilinigenes TaxID=658629 RepID=A0ABX8MV11_9PSED|nr:M48 family metallopeptidase [Pseudomonas sessilinigenes]AZC24092.1 Heat shock protein HtpX [Pseudomonas sessilinigenes]QXH43053.1 M48 family metallopeptidase [Pseudomonas sessilinigenes]
MKFFQHQAQARRRTLKLLSLMALAVASLTALSSLGLGWLWRELNQESGQPKVLNWPLVAVVAALIVLVVLLGSWYKTWRLRAGGKVIAEHLGGRLINGAARNSDEQRLLNIVEEMALASGTTMPAVYVLPEEAINAFAAGLDPQQAVLGVTRGALSRLERDELQGMVAHEFSHIHNGDMRLNTRLLAVIHGLLLFSLAGVLVLRQAEREHLASDRHRFIWQIVFAVLGLALLILGSLGTLLGKLIKAAIGRQREFLADASAVQFTRNPQGLSGALKKIGGCTAGSRLKAFNAAQYSHMYFHQGVQSRLDRLFATHPPLAERIRRLDPQWDGRYPGDSR